ncbi:MAG: transposase, partial [Acidimicrobiales bacterium]
INTTWLHLVLTAHDLLAWCRLLTLDGDLATAEPKRLRYCLFHTAGHLITTGRRRICRLSNTWPWTDQLIAAFTRVHTLPLRI